MKRIKWLSGLFFLVLILMVIIANLGLGQIYFPFVYNVPGLDKIGHFLLMGMLSFLVNLLLEGRRVSLIKMNILAGNLWVAIIVTLEELSQIFLVYRAFSLVDLAFDLGGIFLGGRLAARLRNTPE
jgi:VanZ family protein